MTYDSALVALSDPTRRTVFERLVSNPTSVGDLASNMPVSRPAVSQHLKVLASAGLVTVRVKGTRRIYAADPAALRTLRDWLDSMWDQALKAFAEAAEQEASK